ncbi:hypothetical protein KI387_042338, partial [Taxus chinensis]
MAIFVLANVGTTREEFDTIGEELGHACSPWANLNATAFERNWEALSRNIESNLTVSKFATSTSNIYKTDPVYGFVQCR